MKIPFLVLFLSVSFLLHGQTPDTSAIRLEIDSLIQLNRNLVKERKYDEAHQLIQQAEEKCLAAFGEETPLYGMVVFNKGRTFDFQGDLKSAELYYILSKNIREHALGRNHIDYTYSLYNLGYIYNELGEYKKAEISYLEAIEIRENIFGKDHPVYASCLIYLGIVYHNMGQYGKAETLYLETKSIQEKISGKEHPLYAQSLNNLGVLYVDLGQYEKAEPFYLETTAIEEKMFGKEHPHYAQSLNNLGVLYKNMGQYQKVETLYLEAIAIHEKVLGKNNPHCAVSLINLGVLYKDLGQYQKAEMFYLEAKEIREKVLGREHPHYAQSLNNLGVLYKNMRQYQKAETHYLEAKEIREKVLGNEHPDYANNLNNLGILYKDMGQYQKAETYYLEAKAIYEKVLGKEHPNYANNLNNLGVLYKDLGQYQKAETYYLEAKAIYEKVLGEGHSLYAASLNNLGVLYHEIGQYGKTELYLFEANEIRKLLLLKANSHLSERDMLSYTTSFINDQNIFLSFASRKGFLSGSAFDNSLFYKGFLLSSTLQLNRLAQTDSVSNELFLSLKAYNRRLSKEYSNPVAERDSITLADLEEKANHLEKELARTVAGFGEVLQQVSWQEVQSVLKPGEVAIEFVHYKFSDPDPTDTIMYAALLLRPGDEQPQVIQLFEEKSLDNLLSLHQERRSDYVNDLYALEDRGAAVLDQPRQSLYNLIWEPMERQLEGINKIYFSPSGLLHRINIAAIPLSEEKSLCDQYDFVQVNSTRQLVIPHQNISRTSDALLMGGIEYDLDTLVISPEEERVDSAMVEDIASRGEIGFNNTNSTLRGSSWNYLRYTEKEVVDIDRIISTAGFQTEILTGFKAAEDIFRQSGKANPSPRFIHLATHGFFFPDPVENKKTSALGNEDPIFKMSDHPMIRSGLILAGGNHVWQGKSAFDGMEDGILTAYEISQMNLSNTELVVLSACETGLGDIQGNEGVYGLQRAFKIAGARYLIMSLWQVPDRETKDFMVRFYEHMLQDNMTIPDAFRQTQKEMKDRFYNPHQWAGFVLVE